MSVPLKHIALAPIVVMMFVLLALATPPPERFSPASVPAIALELRAEIAAAPTAKRDTLTGWVEGAAFQFQHTGRVINAELHQLTQWPVRATKP